MFRKFPVAYRLALIVLTGAIGGLVTLSFCITTFDNLLYDGSRVQVERLVQTAASTLDHYYKLEQAGKLERAEAQRLASESLRSLRFGKSGYFWINDLTPRMVMHPVKPELEGQAIGEVTDARGKKIFLEMIRIAQQQGSGFVDYHWPKPDSNEASAKLSFVQHFAPWGWVVGTGIYVDELDDIFWRHSWRAVVVGLLTTLPLLLLAFLVSRSILGQLGGEPDYASAVAQRIAAGNFSEPIPTDRIDRASIVAQMAEMQARLRESLAGLHHSAAQLKEEAGRMAGSSTQLRAATEKESEATMWISAAMEEMAMSLSGVTESAQRASEQSEASALRASQGKAIVSQAAQEISEVAGVIAESTERIDGLRQRTENIGSIVSVIKEIADQTNLLALNAAIEAARAGEAGRGFAVVADEVRKLAERTTTSTSEISQMIQSIQRDTTAFVEVMQNVRPQVERNVTVSNDAVALLDQMNEGAGDSKLRIQEVSASMNELKEISVALAQKLEEVMGTVEQNADIAAHSNEASERVATLGHDIDVLLQRFQV